MLVRQSTSSTQTLERAQAFALSGIIFELLNLPPGRVHRVAHAFAHHEAPRGPRVGQVVFNERHGDIEGKAREGDARLRVEVPLSLARARPTPRDASATIAADVECPVRVFARDPARRLCVPRPRSEILVASLFVFVETLFRDFHSRVFCRPNDDVAGAGDATTGARQDDAYYSQAPLHEGGLPNPRPPPPTTPEDRGP